MNNLPGSPHISPEGEHLDDGEILGVHCDEEEEGNLNAAAQALSFGNNQKTDSIDGYLQQKFDIRVTAVENCSDADCMLPFGFVLLPFGRS